MSRPRPRPRPRAPPASALPRPSTSNAPSSPIPVVVTVDEEDALFMRPQRTAQQWKKLAQIEKESKPMPPAIDLSDDEQGSPRPRKYKKRAKPEKPARSWAKKGLILLISSEEDEDDDKDALQTIDNTPNGKRADRAAGKRKREQSRSRSITPPPPIAIQQIQHARNLVRQTLDAAPRVPSPVWLAADDSIDNITLDPELAKIAREIRIAPTTASLGESVGGGPEIVTIKVRWQPHPLDDAARPAVWIFKMNRHDSFRRVFDQTADMAEVLSSSLVVSYDDKRLFSSATPNSIRIWAEAELKACDKITHEYVRTHRHQRSLSLSPDRAGAGPNGAVPSRSGTQDLSDASDAEPLDSDTQKFKLTLRSALTSKDITLTVRPTTTCSAIVKAFLKSAGLTDKYPSGQTLRKGGKVPMLCLDGDKLDPKSEIGDADLEDGDLVEVVGL